VDQAHLAVAGLQRRLQIGVHHVRDLGRPERVEVEVVLDGEPHRRREGSVVVGIAHGSCYTTRGGSIRRSGIRAAVLEECDSEGAAMIRDAVHIPHVNTGSYPLREGCRARPLVDGEPAFRRICEAVEAARSRVWITVAFIEPDVQMPDSRGSFFDVLDRAVARGVDVRVIFWRPRELSPLETGTCFEGSEEERGWLVERGSRFLARWDSLPGGDCQHQKSWLIDAGLEGEVGFVGGRERSASWGASIWRGPRSHRRGTVLGRGATSTTSTSSSRGRW
jgi:phosphatidylserine/phosphatidylglycerophosphate/cardiolipin synthase-like enzyme